LIAPSGPFAISADAKGRFFAKAPKTLAEFYTHQFPQFLTQCFLVFQEERYTYEQVWNASKVLGKVLKEKFHVSKGERVGIVMRNYPEWCFGFIGSTLMGAVAVPLNSWWGTQELEYGLKDSGSNVLFCDYTRFKLVSPLIEPLNLKVIVVRSKGRELPGNVHRLEDLLKLYNPKSISDTELLDQSVQPDDPAIIMYTSGTTGHPKGVIQTNKGVVNQMETGKFFNLVQEKVAELPGMPKLPQFEQAAIVCAVPLFHATASHHIFLQSLTVGRKVVFMFKWDAEDALRIIEREKITHWTGVPTMALDLMEHPKFSSYDTSSLLVVGAGGAATPPSQVHRTFKAFANGTPSNAYGLTETNGAICINSAFNYLRKTNSVGLAFPIVELKIVDIETGETLGPNQRGELLIKSSLNMLGYWNKPQATAKVLDKENWFRSGDVAVIDDEGFIYIVDRAKDIIIRGGENISSAEVETAFYTHPAVRECAVFGVPDDRLGEVVGIMIMVKKPVTPEELINHVKPSLAGFKIPLPTNIFFTNEPLPRGGTGKILKREIRDTVLAKLTKTTSKL